MKVRGSLLARCLRYRNYNYDKFRVVPGTTVSAEFKVNKEGPILQVQAHPANSYHGAQDIITGGHEARDCGNELVSF